MPNDRSPRRHIPVHSHSIDDLPESLRDVGGQVTIWDEGVPVGVASIINIIGPDVVAVPGGIPGEIDIIHGAIVFLSHWNTADGSNGDQSVSESVSRTTARISTPFGGEGTPFNTGGWANTNQAASLNTSGSFTTPGDTTGFGGDSHMLVVMYDADGVTPLDTFDTPPITGNGVFVSGSGRITVTVTNFAPDSSRFSAHAVVAVDAGGVFTDNGLTGGRYHVVATHYTDTATDGTGPYPYVQSDIFLDTNPTTPSISGLVTIGETGGLVVTKHISGVEYYDLGSQFTSNVTGIDQLNRNTARINSNLTMNGTEYGLPVLNHSPFGTGAAYFAGWTSVNTIDGVTYTITDWAITATYYRWMGPTANISAQDRDPWATGAAVPSADASILVDTWPDDATNQYEDFNGESRMWNASFTVPRNPTAALLPQEAMVFNGRLMVPAATYYVQPPGPPGPGNANWTPYLPNLGGPNPDYSLLTAPVSGYRLFGDDGAPASRASMQIVFSGQSAGASFLADLLSLALEVFVYRVAGSGNTGPPPGNTTPLLVHGPQYNFATFDDGVLDGHIREGSSTGNVINCTFGGLPCSNGFYCHIRINNPAIEIDSMTITYF